MVGEMVKRGKYFSVSRFVSHVDTHKKNKKKQIFICAGRFTAIALRCTPLRPLNSITIDGESTQR